MPVGERAVLRVTWNLFLRGPAFAQHSAIDFQFWSCCSGCVRRHYFSDESGSASRSWCRQLNFSLHFLKLAKLQRQATQR